MTEDTNPTLRSWVESANTAGTDFPIQNLPFGVFSRGAAGPERRIGVAIGDQVLDLVATADSGLLGGLSPALVAACRAPTLNPLMALGPNYWHRLRRVLVAVLEADAPDWKRHRASVAPLLVPMSEASMQLPVEIGDYTDFYASVYHATNVGRLFRPENPLLPNYKDVPIGYHGRASSIVPGGTPVRRPAGQTRQADARAPSFGPSRALDYELELGFLVGVGNTPGDPIPIDEAGSRVFGACLINDWSARDIQAWEYQPLGPFLSKSFATTMSPWIVTMQALAPFRAPAFERPEGDPRPLPYLTSSRDQRQGGIAVTLEVHLASRRMRDSGIGPVRLSRGDFRDMYWTVAQMIAITPATAATSVQAISLPAAPSPDPPETRSAACSN